MSRYFNYQAFLAEFSALQTKMLLLEKERAKQGFSILYSKAHDHFRQLYERNKNFSRAERNYFIKKQTMLILKYLYELNQQNVNLEKFNEREIIKLFEKQYKLKKIILRLMDHIKKN